MTSNANTGCAQSFPGERSPLRENKTRGARISHVCKASVFMDLSRPGVLFTSHKACDDGTHHKQHEYEGDHP